MSIYFGSTTDEELISELEQRGFYVKNPAEDIIKEQDVIDGILKMGAPSLPPDEYVQLENIVNLLKMNRKALREGEERRPVERPGCARADEWKCPECGQKGSYADTRKPLDLGVDKCPSCGEEVKCLE